MRFGIVDWLKNKRFGLELPILQDVAIAVEYPSITIATKICYAQPDGLNLAVPQIEL